MPFLLQKETLGKTTNNLEEENEFALIQADFLKALEFYLGFLGAIDRILHMYM